jgi:imidazolonepropionase-like amidohydrolase
LEPGKLADIISVEGDPLAEIRDLAKVRFIMIEGRRLDPLSFH